MVPVPENTATVLYHLQGTSQQLPVTQQGKCTSLSEDAVISYISFARYQSTATSNSTRQGYQSLRGNCYQLYIICKVPVNSYQ